MVVLYGLDGHCEWLFSMDWMVIVNGCSMNCKGLLLNACECIANCQLVVAHCLDAH